MAMTGSAPSTETLTNCPSTSSRGETVEAWPFTWRIGFGISARTRMVSVLRSIWLSTKSIRPASGYSRPSLVRMRTSTAAGPPRPSKRLRRSSAVRWLTAKATRIGSWLTMVARLPASGPTTLPTARFDRPICPAIGRLDLGVAEVDLRHAHRRLRRQHIGRRRAFQRQRVVERDLRAGAGLPQVPRTGECDARILERGIGAGEVGLCLLDLRLEGRAFQTVEHVALRHVAALAEASFLEEAGDAGADVHAVGGFDAADEFDQFRHRPPFGRQHAHRRRSLGAELRDGGKCRDHQQGHRADQGSQHHG